MRLISNNEGQNRAPTADDFSYLHPDSSALAEVPQVDNPFDANIVRSIINNPDFSPDKKLAKLLVYAFEADAAEGPYLPLPEDAGFMLEEINGWANSWIHRHKKEVHALMSDQVEMRYLSEEDTPDFGKYEWSANASRLIKVLPLHHEARLIDTAVRIIILEEEDRA